MCKTNKILKREEIKEGWREEKGKLTSLSWGERLRRKLSRRLGLLLLSCCRSWVFLATAKGTFWAAISYDGSSVSSSPSKSNGFKVTIFNYQNQPSKTPQTSFNGISIVYQNILSIYTIEEEGPEKQRESRAWWTKRQGRKWNEKIKRRR